MNEIIIRPAKANDVDGIAAIARSEWSAIYDGYREQLGEELFSLFYVDPLSKKEASVRKVALSGYCYVAEVDGRVAAFITYSYDENLRVGSIDNNAVSRDFRGRGIGPRLYEFIFDLLQEKGASAVKVTTGLDDAHASARRAYEKVGFSAHLPSVTYYKEL